jgi:Tfp pilus assembly protein PilF
MATAREAIAIGWKLIKSGQLAQAEQVFRQVVAADPRVAQAWFLLGSAAQLQGKVAEAVNGYERVLALEPNHAEALNNLGFALQTQGKTERALECLERGVQLKPDYADAHSNLGNVLQEIGRLDDAIASYRRALALKPDYADAYNNLANAFRAQGQMALAIEYYSRALDLKPDHPVIHMSRAMALLQAGDFERGWPEYEWRLKTGEITIPAFRQPAWDGSPLNGRTILSYADFGLGDSIQFIRYAPLVADRGGDVVVACPRPLARLFASCRGVSRVVEEGAALPDFDVYALIKSLPGIFGTRLESIPANVPYFSADPVFIEKWHGELSSLDGFKVGIAWQGNPSYTRDRQRSFRLEQLEPLARVAGVRLVSCQNGFGSEQIASVADRFSVTDLGSRLGDFMDTAAALVNLDLVISADTSLAHLAGSVAVPVWVGLPFSPDWRWLLERDSSPWYPTMRLFRQKRWGDWDEVFARMAGEFANRHANTSG